MGADMSESVVSSESFGESIDVRRCVCVRVCACVRACVRACDVCSCDRRSVGGKIAVER